jgi:hypothetical protein
MSTSQFIEILVRDQGLPADIRMAIARDFLPAGTSRSVGVRAAKSSVDKRRKAKSAGPRPEPSGTANPATLDVLFGIAQDATVQADQRRKAASELAQHFLPKKPGIKRWWVNAPPDEYGFAITPQIAAEYRDIKFELRRLTRSGGNSPATTGKVAKMRARLKAILHRLQCPCPSLYGKKQLDKDCDQLIGFARQRDDEIPLSEKEGAEEAHCRARVDCYFEGPESAAHQRLSILQDKERRFRNPSGRGPRLTLKEQTDLRFLRLLYPQSPPSSDPDDELHYRPLRDAPLSVDCNLYPPDSKLPPLIEGEMTEFVDVPPIDYAEGTITAPARLRNSPAHPHARAR